MSTDQLSTTPPASTGMFAAELYKLRTHRTPAAILGVLLLGVLAPAAVLVFYNPADASAYGATWQAVFGLLAPLTAIVYGSWLIGTEYKQGTLKRMLTAEPRRLRALGAKATAGALTAAGGLTAAALTGFGANWLVGNLNDATVAFEGRVLLASGVTALLSGVIGFTLSTITRNAAFGMVAGIGMLLVLDPLLTLIPTFGDYTLGSVMNVVDTAISGEASVFERASIATTTAIATLVAWMGALAGSASQLFARRDV